MPEVGKWIQCKNCGAEYEIQEAACPYCGAENEREKERIRKEDLREFAREREEIAALPKRHLKKRTKIALIALAALLLLTLVLSVAGGVSRSLSEKKERNQAEQEKETMEEYYQAEDYESLYNYYVECESYSPSYRKYWEVASAWNWMEFIRETKEALSGPQDEYVYYGISYALSGASSALSVIEEGLDDGVERGNEEVLEGFREEILQFFREDLKLTEEEIEQVIRGGGRNDAVDWDALDRSVMNRLGLTEGDES